MSSGIFQLVPAILTCDRDNLFHITGTDIVRSLTYRFFAFGRPVTNTKKFEEGIFSDLRNLKPGTDATLEEPKSEFLDLLYKNNCIRTQKKQKVFYWFSVPHDRLFLDALERDLKREKMGQEPTTSANAEPALSFYYDSSMTLFDQLTKAVQQSNSSVNSIGMGRPRTQSVDEYQAHSRAHSRQASEMMPPPAPLHNGSDEFSGYMVQDSHQLELEPPAPIVHRHMDSTQFVPLPYGHQYRSSTVPCRPFTGYEYSPAPQFPGQMSPDEYAGGRAMTYAPETPQSQALFSMSSQIPSYGLLPTPEASVTGDMFTPHSSLGGAIRSRTAIPTGTEPLQVFHGSPTYKQRRRRTSFSQQMGMPFPQLSNSGTQPFMTRPRAVSVAEGGLRTTVLNQGLQRHTTPLRDSPFSRNATPIPGQLPSTIFQANEELAKLQQMENEDRYPSASPMPLDGRDSATPAPNGDESPAKTFTCPVPACGRLFKRLEHLKRHVRTHTQERPYICQICGKKFSRSDNLAQYVSISRIKLINRHRKTHDRTGATQSPSARNTPCDSNRNTPVSGEEEGEGDVSDVSHHSAEHLFRFQSQVPDSQTYHPQPMQAHMRSFSHDSHFPHYSFAPSLTTFSQSIPPNEVDEETMTLPHPVSADNSPVTSDGSNSFTDESMPSYAHQPTYSTLNTASIGVNADLIPGPKHAMEMMQSDNLRRDYLGDPQILDPTIMNQGWSYQ